MRRLRVSLARARIHAWLAVHYRSQQMTGAADRRVVAAYNRLVDREAA